MTWITQIIPSITCDLYCHPLIQQSNAWSLLNSDFLISCAYSTIVAQLAKGKTRDCFLKKGQLMRVQTAGVKYNLMSFCQLNTKITMFFAWAKCVEFPHALYHFDLQAGVLYFIVCESHSMSLRAVYNFHIINQRNSKSSSKFIICDQVHWKYKINQES